MILASVVQTVAPWCLLVLVLAMGATLIRLLRGPGRANRVMALDVMTILAAGIVGTLALSENEPAYLRVALVIALVSFLTTVALALYVQHEAPK